MITFFPLYIKEVCFQFDLKPIRFAKPYRFEVNKAAKLRLKCLGGLILQF